MQYVLIHGLPEWSREHKTGLARCGGASATSEATDGGRGEGQGSEAALGRASDHGGDAGASPVPQEVTIHPGVDSSAGGGSPNEPGRESAAAGLLLLTRAEDGSSERSEAAASGALVVDDSEGTQVGSPLGDAKRLRLGEAHAEVTVQGLACIKFRPSEEDEVKHKSAPQTTVVMLAHPPYLMR